MRTHKKLIVYTAIFGETDTLRDSYDLQGYDVVCFTDNPKLSSKTVRVEYRSPQTNSPARETKIYKIQPHRFFKEYDNSLWLDASVEWHGDAIAEVVSESLRGNSIAMCPHPFNCDAYEEHATCLEEQNDDPALLNAQVESYRSKGLPDKTGLFAGGVIARTHMNSAIITLCDQWFAQIKKFSRRDQISLAYVLWKNNITPGTFAELRFEPPYFRSRHFTVHPHNKERGEHLALKY